MMAENPNWWSLNGSSSSLALNTSVDDHLHNHGYPISWTQLIAGGLTTEEERFDNTSCDSNPEYSKKLQLDEKYYYCISDDDSTNNRNRVASHRHYHVKMEQNMIDKQQQQLHTTYNNVTNHNKEDHPYNPSSCFTSLSSGENNHSNYLDFSSDRKRNQDQVHHQCNDTSSGTSKKARVQPSSTQRPALKVRKEKLGDRITALHQLVSPFGKTDTASVLLEAMGYIRFLEGQIQALSSPYLGKASTASMRIQQSVNDQFAAAAKDLRSRGLSLVPVDCAHHINNTIGIDNNSINNGADYWVSSTI